jgi:23S rRNA pseudouridine1911/1915/1917 synthase
MITLKQFLTIIGESVAEIADYSTVGRMGDQGTIGVTFSWQVPEAEKPIRAGTFARRCLPHLSRREIGQAIRDRLFRVHGKTVKKGDQLSAGNRLDFVGPPSWLAVRPVPNERLRVPIVYEDPALLIVDKPAGLAVHGFSARTDNTLANFLAAQRAALLEVGKSRWEPGMVHRLDRETSGLVVIAKTPETFDHLRRQFRERKVEKIYLALVWGESRAEGVIDFPLAHDPRDKKRMRAMTNAPREKGLRTWQATTRYRKICATGGLSLLEVEMATGVTHQIRVHLANIGHPIVGDRLYGDPQAETFALQRHFLHAWKLRFDHPTESRKISFEVSPPEELRAVLARLDMKV